MVFAGIVFFIKSKEKYTLITNSSNHTSVPNNFWALSFRLTERGIFGVSFMKRCFQTMVICGILVCFGATSLQAGNILDHVRQSGEVRCGVVDANLPGLSILESTGRWTGFWVDMCRAIAAARWPIREAG